MLSHDSLKKLDREIAKYPAGQKRSAVMSALILAQDEHGWLSPEVMDFVAGHVAPHKRVRACEFIDEIPKSASGKILRRVLVERERAAQV
jgi:NADH:ubiquinone oxidoreductase subunit E